MESTEVNGQRKPKNSRVQRNKWRFTRAAYVVIGKSNIQMSVLGSLWVNQKHFDSMQLLL